MYESFYGLKEKPFTLLPDPDYLYLSPKHQRALTLLEYGLMNHAGFSVICGDAGAGKTTLIRRLLAEMEDDTRVGLITNTHQSFGSLLNWVLMAFGLDAEDKTQTQMHQMFVEFLIEQYAGNKRTILIVDEAQNMDVNTLEELRMLSNINADKDQVLQVILVGQLALRDTLRKPEMMQFAQRIAVDYYLESLSETETELYILHRLKVAGAERVIFTPEACRAIYQFSGGTPRLINLLCDTALVYGFAEQAKQISARLVTEVVSEQHHNSIIPTFNTASLNTSARSEKLDKAPKTDPIADLAERAQEAIAEAEPEAAPQQARPAASAPETEAVTHSQQNHGDNSTEHQGGHIEAAMESASQPAPDAQPQAPDIQETSSQDTIEEPPFEQVLMDEEPPQPPPEKPGRAEYEDVYPIIHVDEKNSSNSSLAIGLIGGVLISLLLIVIIGYFFIDTLKPQQTGIDTASAMATQKAELEKARMEAMQKERDAALAMSKALERERDAAIAAAKVQEEIRQAEKRAAELVAEQKRKTEVAMRLAQKRAREAEQAAARAREADRIAREKMRQEQQRLEAIRLQREREELRIKQQQSALIAEQSRKQAAAKQQSRLVAEQAAAKTVKPPAPAPVKQPEEKKSGFSINPCDSPSAKFLSTCKR